MHPDGNRHARNNDPQSTPESKRRPIRRLRWALALVVAALAVAGLIPAAQAATGGASSFTPAPALTATSSNGKALAFSPLRIAGASWYGPGLWGRKTACGETLRPHTFGVAHKRLPCGTIVKFVYRGHALVTQVIDRGPYVRGRAWDLTAAASDALGFSGVGVARLHYAVAREYARPGAAR